MIVVDSVEAPQGTKSMCEAASLMVGLSELLVSGINVGKWGFSSSYLKLFDAKLSGETRMSVICHVSRAY